MIKSMTGYGSAVREGLKKRFTVEIKSVNHRYSDINVKTPRNCMCLEDVLKKTVSASISRGKIDVFLTLENTEGADETVSLNTPLALAYKDALEEMNAKLGLYDTVTIKHLTRFSDIFNVQKVHEDNEALAEIVTETAKEAAEAFFAMRLKEGEKLYEDMASGINTLEEYTLHVEKRAPGIVEDYKKRLFEKINDILGGVPVDEARLLNEVAFFADKVDVNEEIVRLKSHIAQMRELLMSDEPVGRKLDFIIQETNRETNTIGSKCNDLETSKLIIDMKSCIEKLREQIQNIE